jgi:hypothetical protein
MSCGFLKWLIGFIFNLIFRFECEFNYNCSKISHMMRYTTFPEIQLKPVIRDTGDCRWAKPTHRSFITHTLTEHISQCECYGIHTLNACLPIYLLYLPNPLDPSELSESPVPPKPSIYLNLLYLSCLGLIEFLGKP